MLSFTPIEISDLNEMEKKLKLKNTRMAEHCFIDLFLWQHSFKTEKYITNDFLYIAGRVSKNKIYYLAPIGNGDLKKAISLIEEDAKIRGAEFCLNSVWPGLKEEIEHIMPGRFEFSEVRDSEEYIYLSKDLIELSGKKFHSKRNFINRFKINYENRYSLSEITNENLPLVREFLDNWRKNNQPKGDQSFLNEVCAIKRGLDNFNALGLKGLALYLDGNIIAFSYGAKLSEDTFIIQAEKADHTVPGAYAVINNEFAKKYCNDIQYINREEDMGIEGLRKAKLSYNPAFLNIKYKGKLRA